MCEPEVLGCEYPLRQISDQWGPEVIFKCFSSSLFPHSLPKWMGLEYISYGSSEISANLSIQPPVVVDSSIKHFQFSSVQSLSHVWLFVTPWITARQASLSIANSRSLPKPMCIKSVMPSSHLILCHPFLLLPPIPCSIRVFSNESTLRIRWPKYWSFSFSISPSKEHPELISFRMDWWTSLQSKGLSRVFSNTTVQKHQFFGAQPSSQSNSHIHTWPLETP